MDVKGAKKVLVRAFAIYWALVLLIYAVAYPQFRYAEVNSKSVTPSSVIDEITDGEVVTQEFEIRMNRIRGVSLFAGTYDRVNTGSMRIVLSNREGTVLAEETRDAASFKNNAYTYIGLKSPIICSEMESIVLSITTDGCTPGNALTVYSGVEWAEGTPVENERYASLNGSYTIGRLCIDMVGDLERPFYILYWVIVTGVFLLALLLCLYWWSKAKKGMNNPLVAVCTLMTRYGLLFRQLVSRDFKTKYKRSSLGLVWSFLNPLLTMAVQYVVFSTLFKSDIKNFPVYLLTGIVFFSFFSEAVTLGMTSITSNASLIKKVYVPKYIYPFTRVISSLINFLLALVPLFLVMLVTASPFHLSLVLLLFDILCFVGFIIGISLLLTTAMTFFQDTQFLWNVISMIWMYLTPLFYPESIIPRQIIGVYRLNPLYQFITFARICIIDGISPEPVMYLNCILSASLFLVLGVWVFRKYQDRFILYL